MAICKVLNSGIKKIYLAKFEQTIFCIFYVQISFQHLHFKEKYGTNRLINLALYRNTQIRICKK